jgi:hypothetical protein
MAAPSPVASQAGGKLDVDSSSMRTPDAGSPWPPPLAAGGDLGGAPTAVGDGTPVAGGSDAGADGSQQAAAGFTPRRASGGGPRRRVSEVDGSGGL